MYNYYNTIEPTYFFQYPNMLNLLSPEDKAILDRNVKKEGEKMMKQIAKNGLVKMK